jgi:hypothetical protein
MVPGPRILKTVILKTITSATGSTHDSADFVLLQLFREVLIALR